MGLSPSKSVVTIVWLAPLLAATLLTVGCGTSSSAGHLPGAAAITARTATVSSPIGSDHHLSVSALCRPGEQMLAGGYEIEDVFESDYTLLASYPATVDTWTVRADSGSTFQLEAIAYCLSPYPSLGIHVVQGGRCPTGAVELSRGTYSSEPYSVTTQYVVCGHGQVAATSNGFRVGSLEVDCASQSTGNSLSETRSFSYTCAVTRSAS